MDAVVIILIIKTADLINFLRNNVLNRGFKDLRISKDEHFYKRRRKPGLQASTIPSAN
jgi:hypothetical protein